MTSDTLTEQFERDSSWQGPLASERVVDMRTRTKKNPLRCWPLLVLLLLTNTGVAADADASLDPVVADVVEMLQAGVAEAVIIQWLESTGRRPADVRPEGMIALTEA